MDTNNKFYIFKEFLKDNKNIKDLEIERLRKLEGLSNIDVEKIADFADLAKKFHAKSKNNKERYGELLLDYQRILDKTNILAKELKLINSLEYSLLFTYLIHRGYFSKYKILNKQVDGRKNIHGLYQLDIMAGKGVCLNFSEMLKDFLNNSGFNSATIESRDTYKNSLLEKLFIKESRPSHATNLILENGKLYIYDSINEFIFQLENRENAKIIDGSYYTKYEYILLCKYKLYPFDSYCLNNNSKEIGVLDILQRRQDFDSPYTKKDYKNTHQNCIELFRKNIQLISDYRECTSENICNIAKKLELIPNE